MRSAVGPRVRWIPLCAMAVGLLAVGVRGQGVDYVKANYTKFEYRIPMRDGTRLFTAVYVPKDSTRKYPILLTRTPYSVQPYGVDQYKSDLGPSELFGKSQYIFVYQDVRGRWMSEGEFVNMRPIVAHGDGQAGIDESTDTYDTIDWLLKKVENHNGKVGIWGISYPGFYTAAALVDAHPALVAASPQAPITDWFVGDDWHHNGALILPHAFNFFSTFGHPRPKPTTKPVAPPFDYGMPDGYKFYLAMGPLSHADKNYFHQDVPFWNEIMQHGTYDTFWKSRNLRPHLKRIRPAVLTVGGWFDAENLFGALETYKTIEASTPDATNRLVMGPWFHGGWSRTDGASLGDVPFNSATAAFFREKIEFPFFESLLKGKDEQALPEAWVFETGRNQWRSHDAWPPRNSTLRSLYLRGQGRLAFEPPQESDSKRAFDDYVSDPNKPVPFLDDIEIGMTRDYMVADQRFASRRPDVLVYQTEPLEEDLTIGGPIGVDLTVSTSGTDSDWIVKVIDVYPDDFPDPNPNPKGVRMGGFQQLVRGDVMRGKFRNSYESPEPFQAGEPTRVRFTLQDAYHTFRPGHRVMVQIQSTWFPLVDRNPQTFTDIYNAKESDFQKATQRVYHSPEHASRLELRVLP